MNPSARIIHFIGICGTAMATLAAMLKRRGRNVRGSDQNVYPPMSDALAREEIPILTGFAAENIRDDVELVIVGNAISRGNPELEEVLDRRIRYCSLPEALRDHFLWGARSIVIAGTHGKTTTTALAGWLLTHAGLDPSVFIGGIAKNFESSYRLGSGREFVVEGDEYDSAFFDKTAKFLKYLPEVAVITNIEFDHADIYADLDAVRLAFRRLVNLVPRKGLLLLGSDSPNAVALTAVAHCPVETFGLTKTADWYVHDIRPSPRGVSFRVDRSTRPYGEFDVPLLGTHNVRNVLASVAVAAACGINPNTIAEGLRTFRGVKRRLEISGVAHDVTVVNDFAHHPTAVKETLAAVRMADSNRRLWAIFEPRSATACRRIFQQEFAEAFGAADEVVVAGVYRSSLPEEERFSPEELVADLQTRGKRARYIPAVDDIIDTLVKEHRPGDLVVIMSNGGFGGIHERLLAALQAGEKRSLNGKRRTQNVKL